MYVTMNRFKIKPEFADAYIQVWKDAGVRTKDVDGFLEFKFFRLDSKDCLLYTSPSPRDA